MKKVLLVEDDAFIRDIFSIKLTEHGSEVVAVADGTSALKVLHEDVVDVVLLDMDLPDISGQEILKLMRSDDKLVSLPVIVFTNRDDEDYKTAIATLGVSGYFIKASTAYDELYALIDSL